MRKIGKVTVGGLVGLALTVCAGGMAGAAPATTTGSNVTSTTVAPGTAPAKKAVHVLTGGEIWRIVQPHRTIDCAHAAKQLKRLRAADAAAAKRLGHWQTKQATDQKVHGPDAGTADEGVAGRVRGFHKLELDGQALIRRIDAKCECRHSTHAMRSFSSTARHVSPW